MQLPVNLINIECRNHHFKFIQINWIWKKSDFANEFTAKLAF